MEQQINRKNIFLDFMGPDMWKTMPSFVGTDRKKINILARSLNIAVLLTKEYCILPPAFVAQSHLTRKVMQMKADFLKEKVVVFPLRESDLEHYFEKKQMEYSYVKDSHFEFYKKGGQNFIRKHADAIIRRKSSMGLTIAEYWQEIPDDSELWFPITIAEPKNADRLRKVPYLLKERGISVTLEAVKKEANIQHYSLDFAINQAIQHEYLSTYLEEYDAAIIEDVPPKALNLNYLIKVENIYYNYYNFDRILNVFGIDEYLKNASANTINDIRRCVEYTDFLDWYRNACSYYNDSYQVQRYFQKLKKEILISCSKLPFTYLGLDFIKQINEFKRLLELIIDKSYSIPFEQEVNLEKNYNTNIIEKRHLIMEDRIFVVHGRNIGIRNEIELFIRRIGLTPIILDEQVDNGMTIIEKIEKYSDVSCAIVLYTSCDEGRMKGEKDLKDRARQNVIFEHGYMVAKLGRDKVIALVEQGVEIPGDLSGVVYISMQDADWKVKVMRNLNGSGLQVDWTHA